jgi:4-hydroxy-tetrahydrodipicolinate synthase
MSDRKPFRGLLVPTVTPFAEDFSVDVARYLALCQWQLANGASGLAVFGTTSEGNSLSITERRRLLDDLVAGGVPAARLMPGTGACAVADAVELTRHALEVGTGGVLVLPPFYYPEPDEDGLFAHYARLIEQVGDARLHLYYYHIPRMTRVNATPALFRRLRDAYPQTVMGIKDSSGEWDYARRLIQELPDMAIFPGAETFVSRGMAIGAAGCVSATGNIQPRAIADLIAAQGSPEEAALQSTVDQVRAAVSAQPLIPAIKAILARESGDAEWRRLRPPLTPLAAEPSQALFASLGAIPGYRPPELGNLLGAAA